MRQAGNAHAMAGAKRAGRAKEEAKDGRVLLSEPELRILWDNRRVDPCIGGIWNPRNAGSDS
jgi:hypothetical protein